MQFLRDGYDLSQGRWQNLKTEKTLGEGCSLYMLTALGRVLLGHISQLAGLLPNLSITMSLVDTEPCNSTGLLCGIGLVLQMCLPFFLLWSEGVNLRLDKSLQEVRGHGLLTCRACLCISEFTCDSSTRFILSSPFRGFAGGGRYFLTSLWCYHSQADFPNSNSP